VDNTITVAIINGTFLVVGGVLAKQNYEISKHAKLNGEVAKETKKEVAKIERRTNGEFNEKIKAAVREVFEEKHGQVDQAVVAEALNDFLSSLIEKED